MYERLIIISATFCPFLNLLYWASPLRQVSFRHESDSWFSFICFVLLSGYFNPPHFWLWTALTHCFLEIHLWEVVVDIFTLVLVGKLIEPLWGAMEMVTFFFIVNTGTVVILSSDSFQTLLLNDYLQVSLYYVLSSTTSCTCAPSTQSFSSRFTSTAYPGTLQVSQSESSIQYRD